MLKPRIVVLFVAVLSAGVGAGFFLTYAYTIMPGLATTDDRTFVGAFQGLERVFGSFETTVNWPVIFSFFGGPILAAAAIVLNRRNRQVAGLAAVALVLLLSVIFSTLTFNVPRNDELTAAGDPNEINVTQVREDFGEDTWRAWNLVRSGTSSLAFICLASALFILGRGTKDSGDA
jgi:uncharacterized membrane protein